MDQSGGDGGDHRELATYLPVRCQVLGANQATLLWNY